MSEILEILKYTLPSLIVFLTAWFLIRTFLKNEDQKRRYEISMSQKDSILPLRLQAYERLILFLERISPDSLVMRVKSSSLTAADMQNELINAVRTEFEHNLSQQAYISDKAWEMIKNARNEVIRLINQSAKEVKPSDNGLNLSKKILENTMELDNPPIQAANRFLKSEVKELFW
jgi:hypothetical protein